MFRLIVFALTLSVFSLSSTQAAACKNLQIKIRNKTDQVVDIISIEALNSQGQWQKQLALQKPLQPNILWTQSLDLDNAEGKTQLKVSFQAGKSSNRSSNSHVFTCRNNQDLTIDLR